MDMTHLLTCSRLLWLVGHNSKTKENELRKLTVAILSELASIPPKPTGGAKPKKRSSAFAISQDLQLNFTSTLSASKAFLKDYRAICHDIKGAKEQLPIESPTDEARDHLQVLLEKQAKRLKGEIHAMLDGEEVPSTERYGALAEKELWTQFGAADAEDRGKLSSLEMGEGWGHSVKSSKKALRHLTKCLPTEED